MEQRRMRQIYANQGGLRTGGRDYGGCNMEGGAYYNAQGELIGAPVREQGKFYVDTEAKATRKAKKAAKAPSTNCWVNFIKHRQQITGRSYSELLQDPETSRLYRNAFPNNAFGMKCSAYDPERGGFPMEKRKAPVKKPAKITVKANPTENDVKQARKILKNAGFEVQGYQRA